MGTSRASFFTVPGNRNVFGFIQRQYSRRVSSSFGVEQNVAVSAALALVDMDDHPLAVNVGDLEVAQLGSPQSRRV